jgi:hypothetical protein
MGRKYIEKPRMTTLAIDVLDAEIIRQYKYTGEPFYRTVSRIIREYAPPDVVEKCKSKLEAMQKNELARIDRFGQSRQCTLINDDETDKPSERFPKEWRGIPKSDYIEQLAKKHNTLKKFAQEEVQRRIKDGLLLERAGFVEEVTA